MAPQLNCWHHEAGHDTPYHEPMLPDSQLADHATPDWDMLAGIGCVLAHTAALAGPFDLHVDPRQGRRWSYCSLREQSSNERSHRTRHVESWPGLAYACYQGM